MKGCMKEGRKDCAKKKRKEGTIVCEVMKGWVRER
jgi:hypothetical protein